MPHPAFGRRTGSTAARGRGRQSSLNTVTFATMIWYCRGPRRRSQRATRTTTPMRTNGAAVRANQTIAADSTGFAASPCRTTSLDISWGLGSREGRERYVAAGAVPRVEIAWVADDTRRCRDERAAPFGIRDRAGAASAPGREYRREPPGMSLWGLWREDLATHGGDPFEQGSGAVAVHRYGQLAHGTSAGGASDLHAGLPLPLQVGRMDLRDLAPHNTALGRRVRIWHHGGTILLRARSWRRLPHSSQHDVRHRATVREARHSDDRGARGDRMRRRRPRQHSHRTR